MSHNIFSLTSDVITHIHTHIQFPELCDYHDARYSILILGRDGSIVYQSMEETYYKESPDNVEVMISNNLQKDSIYTAEINVSTAVNWTKIQFIFSEY